jgi:hypothetical protein
MKPEHWTKATELIIKVLQDPDLRRRLQDADPHTGLDRILEQEGLTAADRASLLQDIRKIIPDAKHPAGPSSGGVAARAFW